MNRIVKEIRDLPFTFGGNPHSGWLPQGAANPLPTPVVSKQLNLEIRHDETYNSFFLIVSASDGEFEWDTWHASLEDAIQQATFEFGVQPEQWRDCA